MDLTERIKARTVLDPATGCWVWQGNRTEGYGRIRVDGRLLLTHRAMWEQAVGPIPDGRVIDHLCRVRACVNPEHMEVVTPRVNILRGDGVCAQYARRDLCPRGHAYTEYMDSTGRARRRCRECRRQRAAQAKAT